MIVLLLIGLFLTANVVMQPDFERIETELSAGGITPAQRDWLASYNLDVVEEKSMADAFVSRVSGAKLYGSGFFPPQSFDQEQAKQLAQVICDTSSYAWGETTVQYDRNLLFLDRSRKVIGLTQIDSEGEFLRTFPYLRSMKWGRLSEKGRERFFAQIGTP